TKEDTQSEKTVSKETLRYDGKDFAWWRDRLRTELKPALRLEAITAVGTFGISGYPEEAAACILEAVKGHEQHPGGDDKTLTLPPESASRKRAPPAAKPLLAALKGEDRSLRRFAVYTLRHFTAQEAVVQALLSVLQDADREVRKYALYWI